MSLFNFKKKGERGESFLPPIPDLPNDSGLDLPPVPPSNISGTSNSSVDTPAQPSQDSSGLPSLPELPGESDPVKNSESMGQTDSVVKETELEYPDVAKFELPNLSELDLEISKDDNFDMSLPELDDSSLDVPELSDESDFEDINVSKPEVKAESVDVPELEEPGFESLPGTAILERGNNPLFVKVDVFKDILDIVDIAKVELEDSVTLGKDLYLLNEDQTKDMDKLKSMFFDINKKLYAVEELLFSK